jgi:hypothetical protein
MKSGLALDRLSHLKVPVGFVGPTIMTHVLTKLRGTTSYGSVVATVTKVGNQSR